MLNKLAFASDYQATLDKVQRRLRAYLRSSTVGNVHDLRTALRRLRARSLVLPKRSRKKLSKYLKGSRKVFRSSTKLRDHDIILEKLASYPALEQSTILHSLRNRRQKLASASFRKARKLRKQTPDFDPSGLRQRKLEKRYSRIVGELNAEIQTLLPLVKGDPDRVDEIHSLRKLCKELLYLYELSTDEAHIQVLERWQKLLGRIHDSDIVTAYLIKRGQNLETARIIRDLRRSRQEQFEEFVLELEAGNKMKASEEDLWQHSSTSTIV